MGAKFVYLWYRFFIQRNYHENFGNSWGKRSTIEKAFLARTCYPETCKVKRSRSAQVQCSPHCRLSDATTKTYFLFAGFSELPFLTAGKKSKVAGRKVLPLLFFPSTLLFFPAVKKKVIKIIFNLSKE